MASPAFVPPRAAKRATPIPAVTLLVCLPSRWKEFPGNLRAALQPRRAPLKIERKIGQISPRWLSASASVHVLIIAILVWALPRLPLDWPVVLDEHPSNYTAIYYQAPSLPQMEDSRGSAPSTASSNSQEFFHPTQTIRISRGSVIKNKVVDAPDPALARVKGPTANLLSIIQAPLSGMPQLQAQPQPVELQNVQSKIARPAKRAEPQPVAELSQLGNAANSLPRIPTAQSSSLPQLQAQPVELQNVQSKIALPAKRVERQSGAELSQLGNTSNSLPRIPAAYPSLPQLQAQPVELQKVQSKIARPAKATEAQPAADLSQLRNTAGTSGLPTVVISTQPGNVIAVPADGTPGSLAMSPQGRQHPGLAGDNGVTTRSAAPSPGAAGSSHGAAKPHGEPGSDATSGAGSPGGAATGAPNLSPGVTVHGGVVSLDRFGGETPSPQAGVVSLDSFGPKLPPPAERRNPADPPRKPAPIVVVATGRSGGGLNSYGTFKNQMVYTIYFQTAAGMATFQFAEHDSSARYRGELTPPDPLSTDVPTATRGPGIVLSCLLDATGHVQNARVVEGVSPYSQTVLEAVRTWRFHPALNAGQPVAIDALIGIGISVR
ncbi:MAG: energy transducer TonB [Acidobacteriia bacterium]|nr:energy transducer TonB [Terriglobia bacterium]